MEPIRILVVEDDPDFQYLIRQTLVEYPDLFPVDFCRDGETAFYAAERYAPDVVLMDLALPGGKMSGVEAARRIRMETWAKVVILTSYDDPATVIRALSLIHISRFSGPGSSISRGDLPSIRHTELSSRSRMSYTLPHTSGTPRSTPSRP